MGALNILLDTHAFVWWLNDDNRLSGGARRVIADPKATVYVSAASGWEMATKARLGKLGDPAGAIPRLATIIVEQGMTELPITMTHAVRAGMLPGPHRDPFDRMLIAQAQVEGVAVVTSDDVFDAYDVPVVW